MLVIVFLALYVLFDVVDEARLRLLLENHAHDIYDAFQGVRATAVDKASFCFLSELHDVIRAAHRGSRQKHEDYSIAGKPLMGHDVKVSNLWHVRNMWEWLAPGWEDKRSRQRSLSSGAFVHYTGLLRYHDFALRREDGSAGCGPRVGLWAKPYMSDKNYEYVGTETTWELFRDVVGDRMPPTMPHSNKDRRNAREMQLQKKLEAVQQGPFAEQFHGRLGDALAICRRDWPHFSG